MSLTLEVKPHAGRSRPGLLGTGEASTSGMLEMPVLFRLPDVADLPPPTPPQPAPIEAKAPPVAAKPPVPPPAPVMAEVVTEAPAATKTTPPASELSTAKTKPVATAESAESATPPANLPAPRSTKADSGTWFDSHTRLLVACFLVALAAVVFMARAKRKHQEKSQPEPTAASTEWPAAHPGEAAEPHKHDAPELPPLEASAADNATAPSTTALPADSNSNAKVQPPAAGAAAGDASGLFPWKQPDGSARTATRPSTAPNFTTPAAPKLGTPVGPESTPAPQDNSTPNPRGNQYERTGSGLY